MEKEYLDLFAFQAKWNRNKEAIYDCDADVRYTYHDLDERSDRLARILVGRFGLKKGDRVAFCARNSIAHYDMFYAACKTGIIITTYNHMLKPPEILSLMDQERPSVLFYDTILEDRVEGWSSLPYLKALVTLHGHAVKDGVWDYDALPEPDASPLPPVELDPEDILMYIHTGGSTGLPKASTMSYRAVISNCISEIISFGLSYRDVGHQFLPLFHTGGWNVINLPLLFCGGKMVIERAPDPSRVLRIIGQERITVGVAVPTVYSVLAEHPDFAAADFSSVRWLIVGAAPVRQNTLEKYLARGVKMCNSYGMTEVGPNNLSLPIDFVSVEDLRARWNSVGKPMGLNEIQIVSDNGAPVAPGGDGELCFRGPMLFSGYLGQEEETKSAWHDGWMHTGDIARQDPDGHLYVVGRKKNMIIVGGDNVFPVEIEECITRFEGVREACVYGMPDERWGEVPHALVVPKDGSLSREELSSYLRENLSGAKRPREIHLVDSIPRGSVGKVDYQQVRALAQKLKEDHHE